MSDTGERISCKVRVQRDRKLVTNFDAVAHIKRAQYDDRFSVSFGAVEVACTPEEWRAMDNADAALVLEDNRTLVVRLHAADVSQMQVIQEQVVGEESCRLYFVQIFGGISG